MRTTPGKRGETVEGVEGVEGVLVLGAGVALGIPCCRALSASLCWWWHCCLSWGGNARMRQRGAQTCWQRALQAHTWVKIGRASQLLVFCLICYPKAFLQNYHGHKPARVQNSLPILCYDNENTADIFNLKKYPREVRFCEAILKLSFMSNNMYVTQLLNRHLNKEASLVLYVHKTLILVGKETLSSFSTCSFFDLHC